MAESREKKSKINLNDIKSSYVFKSLFFFLYEKQKLELVKYNNKLKNKLFIDNNDYKECQGDNRNFLIIEKDGKGKEICDSLKLIYEGEYLNGKKNGKIKKYNYARELLFEGEYLKGKKMEKQKNIMKMVN